MPNDNFPSRDASDYYRSAMEERKKKTVRVLETIRAEGIVVQLEDWFKFSTMHSYGDVVAIFPTLSVNTSKEKCGETVRINLVYDNGNQAEAYFDMLKTKQITLRQLLHSFCALDFKLVFHDRLLSSTERDAFVKYINV